MRLQNLICNRIFISVDSQCFESLGFYRLLILKHSDLKTQGF